MLVVRGEVPLDLAVPVLRESVIRLHSLPGVPDHLQRSLDGLHESGKLLLVGLVLDELEIELLEIDEGLDFLG